MLDLPNLEVFQYYSVVQGYNIRDYDFIFVPSRFENNPDHFHAYSFFKKMIRKQSSKALLVEYEVWVPIPDPQVILDISDVIEKKKELLQLYHSQLECYDYERLAYGLSLYRGGRFKRKNVEAFFVQPQWYHLKKLICALTTYAFRQKVKAFFHWTN